MNLKGKYDSDLQMFVDRAREPDRTRLRFLRWLAERGWLEHQPVGPPTGLYADPTLGNASSAVWMSAPRRPAE